MKRGRNQRRRPQSGNINRSLDSNGPEVRIRGTANQIHEKYLNLARDAQTSGNRVKAESYFQHAEHYFRLIRAAQPTQPPQQNQPGQQDGDNAQPEIEGEEKNADPRGNARRNGADRSRDDERAPQPEKPTVNKEEDQGEEQIEEPVAASETDSEEEPKKPRRRRARRPVKEPQVAE